MATKVTYHNDSTGSETMVLIGVEERTSSFDEWIGLPNMILIDVKYRYDDTNNDKGVARFREMVQPPLRMVFYEW